MCRSASGLRDEYEAVTAMGIPEPGHLLRSLAPAPDMIEPLSIERLIGDAGRLSWTGDDRTLALRLAYAVADPGILDDLVISEDAVAAGIEALFRGRLIVVDVRMLEHGIGVPALRQLGVTVRCGVDTPEVARDAKTRGITRSAQAILAQADDLDGSIVAIGNAPTALLALLDLIDAGLARPALVLGFPVGYVAAAESKAELMMRHVPFITLRGRRGGTPLAVSAVNTLLRLAAARIGDSAVAEPVQSLADRRIDVDSLGVAIITAEPGALHAPNDAILLVGHGSREANASHAMEQIAREIEATAGCTVETAFLQIITPTVLDGIAACVGRGARHITVMPYFLHTGRHVRYDLPALLDTAAVLHPGLRLSLARPLGFSDALADLVIERVRDADSYVPAGDAPGLDGLGHVLHVHSRVPPLVPHQPVVPSV